MVLFISYLGTHITNLDALSQTKVGDILSQVSEQNIKDFYERYLHDFVRYVHKSRNRDALEKTEYEVCMCVCACVCVYVCERGCVFEVGCFSPYVAD